MIYFSGSHLNDHCLYCRSTEKARGAVKSRWSIEKIIDRGYALVTAWYTAIEMPYDKSFQMGIHPLFYKPGQTQPENDEWSNIGSWAWAMS
jgi:hypothetical protein